MTKFYQFVGEVDSYKFKMQKKRCMLCVKTSCSEKYIHTYP